MDGGGEASREGWSRGEKAAVWVAAAAAVGLVGMLGWMPSRKPEAVVAEKPAAGRPATLPEMPEAASEEEARVVLEAYFEAADVESRAKWVRDGGEVVERMRDYYDVRGKELEMMSRVSRPRRFQMGGEWWLAYEVELWGGRRMAVAMVWEDGRFRIDWESMVAYGEKDWVEWCEAKPAGVYLMRLRVSRMPRERDSPGSGDEYVLQDREGTSVVAAGASPECVQRLEVLTEGKVAPMQVRIEWREGVATVVEVVAGRWYR